MAEYHGWMPRAKKSQMPQAQRDEYMRAGQYIEETVARAIQEGNEHINLIASAAKERIIADSCPYLAQALKDGMTIQTVFERYRTLKGKARSSLSGEYNFQRSRLGLPEVRLKDRIEQDRAISRRVRGARGKKES